MEDSILNTVKKVLLLTVEDTDFDLQLIIYINSVLMILNQLGIGQIKPFIVSDVSDTWEDFLGEVDDELLHAVRSYVSLRVKILFDPPGTSFVLDSLNNQISEYEWRLTVQAEERRKDLACED